MPETRRRYYFFAAFFFAAFFFAAIVISPPSFPGRTVPGWLPLDALEHGVSWRVDPALNETFLQRRHPLGLSSARERRLKTRPAVCSPKPHAVVTGVPLITAPVPARKKDKMLSTLCIGEKNRTTAASRQRLS